MPYFKNRIVNILLIHIPKTGGTSIEYYFSKKFMVPLNSKSLYMFLDQETKKKNNILIDSSMQHMTYQTIMKYRTFFGINFNNIKMIAVVRNPYERIVSDLFFQKKITKTASMNEVTDAIKIYLTGADSDNHRLPQYMYITDVNKKLIPNIAILRTENLTNDMHKLGYRDFCNHNNKCKETLNYYSFLNDESIRLINDYYADDFRLFNYSKK